MEVVRKIRTLTPIHQLPMAIPAIPTILIFPLLTAIRDHRDPIGIQVLGDIHGRVQALGDIHGRMDPVGIHGPIQALVDILIPQDPMVILDIHNLGLADIHGHRDPEGIPVTRGSSLGRATIQASQAPMVLQVSSRDQAALQVRKILMVIQVNSQAPVVIPVLRNRGQVDILVHRQNRRGNVRLLLCHQLRPRPRQLRLQP